MAKHLRYLVLGCWWLSASVCAEDYLVALFDDEPTWQASGRFDISSEQQRFDTADSSVTTAMLFGDLSYQRWTFSVALPYLWLSGEEIVVNQQPRLLLACNSVQSLTDRQRQRLAQSRPQLVRQLANCDNAAAVPSDYDAEGVGDITLETHFSRPLAKSQVWRGSVSVGLKADNASAEQGLGSGTREIWLSPAMNWQSGDWYTAFSAAHYWVVGGQYEGFIQDYSTVSTQLGLYQGTAWRFWLAYDWQQGMNSAYQDVNKTSLGAEYQLADDHYLTMSVSDYKGQDFPNASLRIGWSFVL